MNEKTRDNYFTAVRTILLLMTVVYTVISGSMLTAASSGVLLLLALFTAALSIKEIFPEKQRVWFIGTAALLCGILFWSCGRSMFLLAVITGCEILAYLRPLLPWYFLPLLPSFLEKEESIFSGIMVSLLLCIIYSQHDHVVRYYRDRTREDDINEQQLKHDMGRKEHELRVELQRSLLSAENQVLEERAQLSQTLHDKLGHNINGSVYQLEAVKLLMEKDPERSRTMVQAVIDQLRTGMDEIRAILRKKRPEKHLLAASQLEKLCEDCRAKGIAASLVTEGELSSVPENYLEIILDNSFEAVSNSLKYSGCTEIKINICVMNKFVRCSIADNGRGCAEVADGMGISGMRRRVRQVNGILEIEPDMGFKVNMLLPL